MKTTETLRVSLKITAFPPLSSPKGEQLAERFEAEQRYLSALLPASGVTLAHGKRPEIDLRDASIDGFVDTIAKKIGAGELALRHGEWEESVALDKGEWAEWYEMAVPPDGLRDVARDPPQIDAGASVAGRDVAYFGGLSACSERFKQLCEKSGWTGVDFYWLRDVGTSDSPQWYLGSAANALGRGIDHPWLDPAEVNTLFGRIENGYPVVPSVEAFRRGHVDFDSSLFRPKWRHDIAAADRLFELHRVAEQRVSCHGVKRMLRPFAPATDFAFIWRNYDFAGGKPRATEQLFDRWPNAGRTLCVRGHVAQALRAAGMIPAAYLRPILMLDEPPQGCAQLDGAAPLPPPAVSEATAARYRAFETQARNEYQAANRTPEKLDDQLLRLADYIDKKKTGLSEWALRKLGHTGGASAGAIEKAGEKLTRPIPRAWGRILAAASDEILSEIKLLPLASIVEYNTKHPVWLPPEMELDATDYLIIAHSVEGDEYVLELPDRKNVDDCRVLRIDHEGPELFIAAAGIAEFLAKRMDAAERGGE